MSRLGIYASQNWPRVTNSYESISTVTVGAGGSSSISFTSIPSTYKHLQIRALLRGNRTGYSFDNLKLQFNGDSSTSSYATHILQGDGTDASAQGYATSAGVNSACAGNFLSGPNAITGVFGASVIDILDYTNTSKYKTCRGIGGLDNNNATVNYRGVLNLASGVWLSTTAITSITITGFNGGTLSQYSQAALYGVKG